MIFFEEVESPELPELPLFPLSPGAPDDEAEADSAATTLLVVLTLLMVLVPLTETTVVTICWVTLPVRDEVVDGDVECEDVAVVVEDFVSAETVDCEEVPDEGLVWVES